MSGEPMIQLRDAVKRGRWRQLEYPQSSACRYRAPAKKTALGG